MKKEELPYSEITNVSNITCFDKNGKANNKATAKINFINSNKDWYLKTTIDGGLFTDADGTKCDYKLEKYNGSKNTQDEIKTEYESNPANGNQYFVELKGTDVEKAFLQLEATIQQLNNKMEGNYAFVVFSNKCPNSATDNQKKIMLFKKRYNIKLEIHKTPHEFKLS